MKKRMNAGELKPVFVLKSLGEADTYADDLYYNTIEPCCKKEGIEMDKNADRII